MQRWKEQWEKAEQKNKGVLFGMNHNDIPILSFDGESNWKLWRGGRRFTVAHLVDKVGDHPSIKFKGYAEHQFFDTFAEALEFFLTKE